MKRLARSWMFAAVFALNPPAIAQDAASPERSERSMSEILAGVSNYSPETLALLAELGEKPEVLAAIAKNPQVLEKPDLVEGDNAAAIRETLKKLERLPELAAIAASFPAETRKLAELLRETPEGARDRLNELRSAYAALSRESARAWEELLRKDPVALGEYRDLLTRFSQEQRLENDQFAAVQVTNRDYYVALTPNDMIMQYAMQTGAPAGIKRVLERWWERYAPQARDRRVLLGATEALDGVATPGLAEADPQSRASMFKSIDSPDPASVGLAPVILQPAADQPEEARLAFAMMEHARIWSGPPPAQPQQSPAQEQVAQQPQQQASDPFTPGPDTLVIRADPSQSPPPAASESQPLDEGVAEATVDAVEGSDIIDTLVLDEGAVDTVPVDTTTTIVDAPEYTVVDSVYGGGVYSSYYSGWPIYSTYRRYYSVPIYTTYVDGYWGYPYGCWPNIYVYASWGSCNRYYWHNYGAPYRCGDYVYATPYYGRYYGHGAVYGHRNALLRNYNASLARLGTLPASANGTSTRLATAGRRSIVDGTRIARPGATAANLIGTPTGTPRSVSSNAGARRGGASPTTLSPGGSGSRTVTPRSAPNGVPRSFQPRSTTNSGSRSLTPRSTQSSGSRSITPRSTPGSGSRSIAPRSTPTSGTRTITPRSSSSGSGSRMLTPRSSSGGGTRSLAPRSAAPSGSRMLSPRSSSSSGTRSYSPRFSSQSGGSRMVAPRSFSSGRSLGSASRSFGGSMPRSSGFSRSGGSGFRSSPALRSGGGMGAPMSRGGSRR